MDFQMEINELHWVRTCNKGGAMWIMTFWWWEKLIIFVCQWPLKCLFGFILVLFDLVLKVIQLVQFIFAQTWVCVHLDTLQVRNYFLKPNPRSMSFNDWKLCYSHLYHGFGTKCTFHIECNFSEVIYILMCAFNVRAFQVQRQFY